MIGRTRMTELISIMHADTSKSDLDYPEPDNPTILSLEPIEGHKDIYANIVPVDSGQSGEPTELPKRNLSYSVIINNILTGEDLKPVNIPQGSYIFWSQGTLVVESATIPHRCEKTREITAVQQL